MSATFATQIVRDYLTAMEARDLDRARTYLSDGFTMTFPGGAQLSTPEELVAWSKPRYKSVWKDYERFDEAAGNGETMVYCFGTLYGEWNDGTKFKDIRFIDRFNVRNGKLAKQDVWNDMGEILLALHG
jgi:ketosteroid isomerase-like protein